MKPDSKIYNPGHTGLVGSALLRRLQSDGFSNLVIRNHSELDLERQSDVEDFFGAEKPEYVFLSAAKVGGIRANNTYPAEFIYSNLAIQTNVLHAAWKFGVGRLLFLGSSCIYPRECPQPMKEEYLLTGPLEPTNQPYAVAKIAGVIQCEAYNRQYGTRFLAVMPTNLYGPNDNYDLENSHALPALIRKFHLAKLASNGQWDAIERDEKTFGSIPHDIKESLGINAATNRPLNQSTIQPKVLLWGTGGARREFLHVDDMADACILLMGLPDRNFDSITSNFKPHALFPLPLINIGCGEDQTIRELASIVAGVVGYSGDVMWDTSQSDGTPMKLLDISRLKSLGWKPKISLIEGIKSTYQSYLDSI
ncbi:MAG: GDP-L-fucose synthase [Thermodesulfobacteriota bacterium]|nr:GDP-L-fucose synthase [Thermodesulfobacteriota bacterium]